MALAKITLQLGQKSYQAVVAAGSDIAGTADAMEINIDSTKMGRGDAVKLLEDMKHVIARGKWPLL